MGCISDIEWIPLLYSMFGFWMFSNMQMFHNIVLPINTKLDIIRYDHNILDSLKTISPGYPLLITFIIGLLFKLI